MPAGEVSQITWQDLSYEVRDVLGGKLVGLYGAVGDAAAFDALPEDKQQGLLLLLNRMRAKRLWHVVRRVQNVYGLHGVGLAFNAWPLIESTLAGRDDFTRRFANHKDCSGGFYEKGRPRAVLHFLYQNGEPRKWYVHFDLFSPVYSPRSAASHLQHEVLKKFRPDWRTIKQYV
ncbi:MAG TPA: hypothetical protein VJS64_01295 [Pyrinomonadaceae bacterium]|nr:hypothetical protein [Pyrinomonadaceae bacterium]